MKKALFLGLSVASGLYGVGLASLLQEKKQHVTHATDENKFPLPLKINLQDATSLVLRKSKTFQNMLNSCVPSEEKVSIPLFTSITFKNLEKILNGTKVLNNLSFNELIDVLKMYDFLHIQSESCTIKDIINAIARYDEIETIIRDDGLLDDWKKEVIQLMLVNHHKPYLFSKKYLSYQKIDQFPQHIFFGDPSDARVRDILQLQACELAIKCCHGKIHRVYHKGALSNYLLSADGRYAVTGSEDRTAKVYDRQKCQEIATITHRAGVVKVAISADGRYVVTGSEDGIAKVYDTQHRKEIAKIIHQKRILSVAISADGRYIGTGSVDKTTKIYDMQTHQETTLNYDNYVISIAIPSHGCYAILRSSEKSSSIYDMTNQQEVATFSTPEYFYSSALSADGQYLEIGPQPYALTIDPRFLQKNYHELRHLYETYRWRTKRTCSGLKVLLNG